MVPAPRPEPGDGAQEAQQQAAGERALLSLIASLQEPPGRGCVALLSATGLYPTDGGAPLLDIVHWILAAATSRGPATVLRARLDPTAIDLGRVASQSPR